MPYPFITIGPLSTHTYTLLLAAGIAAAVGLVTLLYRLRFATPPGATVDVCIAALIGGIILGRLFHVALNSPYFQLHPGEIRSITSGGLDWHGGVIGALLVGYVAARMRGVNWRALLDLAAVALPLIAFMGWWGCGANHCAYGAEVDNLSNYPSWLVWERNDIYNIIVPRYATQPLGMMFAAGLGLLTVIRFTCRYRHNSWGQATPWGRPYSFDGRRFWLTLILFSMGMFVIGFLRGDYAGMVAGLRLDQWLDAGIFIFCAAQWIISRHNVQSCSCGVLP